jgi:hypothetical protein
MKTVSRIPSNFQEFIEFANSNSSKSIFIFGADIAGKIVNKVLDKHSINVSGFIDNNKNKTDVMMDNIFVYKAIDFIKNKNKDSIILIASTYISDIIRQLEDAGFYNWAPIHGFLDIYNEEDYREMLKGDLRKNHSGGEFTKDFDIFVLNNMKNSQIKYLNDSLYVRSVDIVITEKCSLKCVDCSNLMQYYEKPINIEFDQIKLEIDRITACVDEINELRIIGGDGFMNKDFPQIANYAASKNNVNKVVIYTNGTIAPNIQKIKEIGSSKKIFVFITTYGALSGNSEKLAIALDENNIQYNKQPAYGWTDCGQIVEQKREEDKQTEIFQNCCAKHFTTLTDNKLFRCPFAANLHRLEATPDFENDYIELKDVSTLSDTELKEYQDKIKTYLREITHIKYCDFCNGRTYGDPEIEPGVQTKTPIKYIKFEKLKRNAEV